MKANFDQEEALRRARAAVQNDPTVARAAEELKAVTQLEATLPERQYAEQFIQHGNALDAFKVAFPERVTGVPIHDGVLAAAVLHRGSVTRYIKQALSDAGATPEKAGAVVAEALNAEKPVIFKGEVVSHEPDHRVRLEAVDRLAKISGWYSEQTREESGALLLDPAYAFDLPEAKNELGQ